MATSHYGTFTAPDWSNEMSIPELWDFHRVHSAEHPLFLYVTEDGDRRAISWAQTGAAIHRAARIVINDVGAGVHGEATVIGILANADTFTFWALIAGVIRAGFVPFPISIRNSAQAVAHLMRSTHCLHLILSRDPAMQALGESALRILADTDTDSAVSIGTYPMPTFEALYAAGDVELMDSVSRPNLDATGMILHSSGTTNFPKPIIISHRTLTQWARVPTYGELDLCGHVMSFHAVPMFHGMGAHGLCWPAGSGVTIAGFAPRAAPVVPTADNVLSTAVAAQATLMFLTPLFIEQWSRDPSLVPLLKTFKHVLFGGAPLSTEVGDTLASEGVSLVSVYASTETGCISMFIPDQGHGRDWSYFTLSPHLTPAFVPNDELGDGAEVFEAVILSNENHTPSVLNTLVDGKPGYATGDLVARHPHKPELWKVVGRADDQIMLSTGEKTNPGPIEKILAQDPLISAAVMFGRGRFQSGVLVEPTPASQFDPADEGALSRYRNEIWPTVEKANEFAPQHSRIFKEMIVVAHPEKPFEYTPKNTPRRHFVVAAYAAEIDAAYSAVEEASQTDVPPPALWDERETTQFVRAVVGRVMKNAIGDDDDLFQFGCDSLQATWIRNAITHALRQRSAKTTRALPFSFVYQNPSVRRLSQSIIELLSVLPNGTQQSRKAEMEALVAELTKDWPVHHPTMPVLATECVLLTGSTGGLGSYVLASLLETPSITRVYALNRAGPAGSRKRQIEMMRDRGLDPSILGSEKVVMLEGDTSLPGLGLAQDVYEEVRTSVTAIIHNAWKVDFNMALSSFKPNVVGVRNLVDLALSSPFENPPRVLFVSSIGVLLRWPRSIDAPEAPLEDTEVAEGQGYSESKWVSERILGVAARETPLCPIVVRLGQMAGGSNGAWHIHEWFPSLVRTSIELGMFPGSEGYISWVPAHTAAAALVEFRNSPKEVLHLVHPSPIPWSTVAATISQAYNLSIIPYNGWVEEVERSAMRSPIALTPAAKLLDFFKSMDVDGDAGREVFGLPTLSTAQAVSISSTMASLKERCIEEDDVMGWLRYWALQGVIPSLA